MDLEDWPESPDIKQLLDRLLVRLEARVRELIDEANPASDQEKSIQQKLGQILKQLTAER
jgi:hypothetical protein